MKKQIDPIRVRQARQGRPVLIILTISLFLAIICGAALWFAFADRNATGSIGTTTPTAVPVPEQPTDG